MDDSAQNTVTVNLVVIGLILVGLIGLGGVIWLTHDGVAADSIAVAVALVGPAIGGLVGILANTKSVNVKGLQQLADVNTEQEKKVAAAEAKASVANIAPPLAVLTSPYETPGVAVAPPVAPEPDSFSTVIEPPPVDVPPGDPDAVRDA